MTDEQEYKMISATVHLAGCAVAWVLVGLWMILFGQSIVSDYAARCIIMASAVSLPVAFIVGWVRG